MMRTLDEIFGKIENDFSRSDFLQMQIRWKWTFDNGEKGRMSMVANGPSGTILTINSRETGSKVWASHTASFTFDTIENNSKFKDSVIKTEWGKIFLSAVENFDISNWKKVGETYYYTVSVMRHPLQFSIERLDHKFDQEHYPEHFGKYCLEIMGNQIVFENVESAMEGARTFLVMLSKVFKPTEEKPKPKFEKRPEKHESRKS